MKKILLGITGSSGAPIGVRLLEVLLENPDVELGLIVSDSARLTLKHECALDTGKTFEHLKAAIEENFRPGPCFRLFDTGDLTAPAASGSHRTDAMIVAPCSLSTLSSVACGITTHLIHRAASVMLKEKRTLILMPRESPLSPIHLKNMTELSQIGVHIVPPTLAFYTHPQNIQDMIDFVCARVLDLAGIAHTLSRRWQGKIEPHELHPRIQGYLE